MKDHEPVFADIARAKSVLAFQPEQIIFVDRHAEYTAALALAAEYLPTLVNEENGGGKAEPFDVQLIEFDTAAFDPETAVIQYYAVPLEVTTDETGKDIYPWVCRYPGVWVKVPWGSVFTQYDEHFRVFYLPVGEPEPA